MMNKLFPEYDEYITPDGHVFKFTTDDTFSTSYSGGGFPEINYILSEGPGQFGSSLIGYSLKPRIIQLIVDRKSCDRYDFWRIRSEFLDIFRPNRQYHRRLEPGVLRKYLPDGRKINLDVLISEGFRFDTDEVGNKYELTEVVRFIAFDPIYYSDELKTVNFAMGSLPSELKFPATFPIFFGPYTSVSIQTIDYAGLTDAYTPTFHSYPVITIVGPCSGPLIDNMTLDVKIKLNYAISGGETVTIDLTKFGEKTVKNNLGVDLSGTVDFTVSDLRSFRIAPDPEAPLGHNVIKIYSTNNSVGTSITLQYRERYIGI
jgi:hypothetical protein